MSNITAVIALATALAIVIAIATALAIGIVHYPLKPLSVLSRLSSS